MASGPQAPNDKKRVKVYELKDGDWYDRGTGFCSGIIDGVSRGMHEEDNLPVTIEAVG